MIAHTRLQISARCLDRLGRTGDVDDTLLLVGRRDLQVFY